MSTKLKRPPASTSAAEFFETWLPAEYARVRESGELTANPPDNKVSVALVGDAGGEWTLSMADSALTTSAGADADAAIKLSSSVQDFRALVIGEDGDHQLLPDKADAGIDLNLLVADKETQDILDSVSGMITFQITGFNGRDWSLSVSFKGASEPAANIAVPAEVYKQISDGSLPAPQAYFSGQIQMTGDATFAMQLVMALMQRQQ